MRQGRTAWVGALGAAAGIGLAAGILHARDTGYPAPPFADRLLYVRSGAVADRLALSFDSLVADVYWVRAIQHYGRDRRSARVDRFELLEPLLDLTTTLDPTFGIAYRFGAIFLSLDPPDGPGRTDLAVSLLEKGLRHNPGAWQYAHDIGFVHYWFSGDYAAAGRWFERAGDMAGAPVWIGPLAAVTLAQGGDRDGARRLLQHLLESPEAFVNIRSAAERGLMQLAALDLIDDLQARVEAFAVARGVYPSSWNELLGGVPLDPTSEPFVYDPETHRVSLSNESTLNPLPPVPAAR